MTIQAGRYLDSLVAKHVFGWETETFHDALGDALYIVDPYAERVGSTTTTRLIGGSWQRAYTTDDNVVEFFGRYCPGFSVGIVAAWDIVDYMRSLNNARSLDFRGYFSHIDLFLMPADRVAHAICIAALRAFDVEVV